MQYGSKYFACRPPFPGPSGPGQKSNFIFSAQGQVAYQVKGKEDCSNMQVHILSLHTPLIPVMGSKVKTLVLLKEVMLYIKLKGVEHRASCEHISCLLTHT